MKTFLNTEHEKFKKYFSIKDTPSGSDKKLFKKAYKYISYIRWIPGLRFIGIGNSTSMFTSSSKSDIDLFIVTSPNRMWIVRILITLIFTILGVRKTSKKHEKRFCLSFFVTTDGMDFKDFAIKNDIYLYFWIVYLKPILDFDETYSAFISSQSWADFSEYKRQIEKNKSFIKFYGKTFGDNCKILDMINNALEKIFLPKTLKHYEKLGKPYGIVINKNVLKFHNNDKRKEIRNKLLNGKPF